LGLQECLYLGNLSAKRDWGHAKDYVRMQWLMLQQDEPEDYVIASGEQHSVRAFCEFAFGELGITLRWEGEGINEVGIVQEVNSAAAASDINSSHFSYQVTSGQTVVRIDPRYFRPTEVETLLGDATKAKEKLGWQPEITFQEMVREMVHEDLKDAQRDTLCQREGFKVFNYNE